MRLIPCSLAEDADFVPAVDVDRELVEVRDQVFEVLGGDLRQVHVQPLLLERLIHLALGGVGDEGGELEARPDEFHGDPDVDL